MPKEYLIAIIAVGVLLLTAFVIICASQYTKLSKLKSTVKESFSTLDIFLSKRLEILLSFLGGCSAETLKNKEISNLLNVVTELKQNLQTQRRFKLETSLDNAVKSAMLTIKNLKNAKTQQTIVNLEAVQADIISTKNYYNNNVENYNKKLNKFPANIVARMFGFKKEYYIK